ncbi:MAG: class II glutamine amidotransferase [Deltaproteobacteria bacterium]|nr:MAG: class II glutamine amidotransferase [Deltaproteobacteria bacterium]TNF28144.1 MAG: class II glutamine amidotransferase [Deltaproteobacteria bacterium]
MCRIFGFRSVINSQVHTSLVQADNALEQQSLRHPDGWGVSYYVNGAPHVVKSDRTALDDSIFKRVSGVVSSQTVIAHIRNATLGKVNILNTHPFQFGSWTFAHNGNIKNFEKFRDEIVSNIAPGLKRFILGTTDSETFFYFILTRLQEKIELDEKDCPIETLSYVVRNAVEELISIIGEYSKIDDAGETETYLTFILTNGQSMVAHHGGKNLFYSTYKNHCGDRDSCPSFSDECENPTKTGKINHLIFASEPLSGDNIWLPMKLGQIIGVDGRMKITINER